MKLIVLSPNLSLIFSKEQRWLLEKEFEVEYFTDPSPLDTISILGWKEKKIVALDPDFCGWKVDRDDIYRMNNVLAICLQTTGYQYVDVHAARERWIKVVNLPGYSTESVAEYAIMLMFGLVRKLPLVIQDRYVANFDIHRWMEIIGKRAGVIGLGKIGSRIAGLTQSLGMKTHYWSRKSQNQDFVYSDLDDLITQSDVIFIALPYDTETESLYQRVADTVGKDSIVITITHPINHSRFIELARNWALYWYGCDDDIGDITKLSGNIMSGAQLWWCTDECLQRNGDFWIQSILQAKNGEFNNVVL